MATIITQEASKQFEKPPLEVPLACAVCSVMDLGMQLSTYGGKETMKRSVAIAWEFAHKMQSGPDAGKNYVFGKTYTWSLHPHSNLFGDLELWLGSKIMNPAVALKGFDLDKLIGVSSSALLTEGKPNAKGNRYVKILSIKLAEKGSFVLTRKGFMPKWIEDLQNTTPVEQVSSVDLSEFADSL